MRRAAVLTVLAAALMGLTGGGLALSQALEPYIILGRPTDSSVTARVTAPSPAEVYIEYGEAGGDAWERTAAVSAGREEPATLVLEGLKPATRYTYRLGFSLGCSSGTSSGRPEDIGLSEEYSFTTARAAGQGFSFVIQSDSHLLNKADREVYERALREIAGLQPDFLFDLGDTFLNDQLTGVSAAAVDDVTYEQVPYLSLAARTAPLFLVLGNHEGEYGYLLDGTAGSLPVLAAQARKRYFPNPVPGGFYSGNTREEPFIGLPENYYAFQWGDALFVALDPYRYTQDDPTAIRDNWAWTLGEEQYRWLQRTLEESTAAFKFVFAHHAIGNVRGGAGVAGLYEWGGADNRGRDMFARKRPGWEKPVQQLMEDTGVTIFFQGHDHLFAREQVGGVVYQTLPKPAEVIPDRQNNFRYYEDADIQLNSGYLSVSVGPEEVRVDYRRSVVAGQPQSESTGVVYSYTVDAGGKVTVLKRTDDSAGLAAYGGGDKGGNKGGDRSGSERGREGKPRGRKEPGSGPAATAEAPGPPGEVTIEPAGGLHARPLAGIPTDSGITISTFFENAVSYYYRYGASPDRLDGRTGERSAGAGDVVRDTLEGLEPGGRYSYRLVHRDSPGGEWEESELYSFATRKTAGNGFSFLVQADPHLDESSSGALYEEILSAMAEEQADFVVDLGDSSMAEKLASTDEEVWERNMLLRSYWDNIAHSLPFFMVMGNHDGEVGWKPPGKKTNTAAAAAVRRTWFLNPAPGDAKIYSGLSDTVYSWEWGDALFVVLDPFAYTTSKPQDDNWEWTLSKAQYDWLYSVLKESTARYRFLFIHHLVGGVDSDGRGGKEAAALYEWGGRGAGGDYEFDSRRPGWEKPIHELCVEQGVDVVFHGHDHFYARQVIDDIIYQLVPQPTFDGRQAMPDLALEYGYLEGDFLSSPGYMRVRVEPEQAVVELLQGRTGQVTRSYTIEP